MFAKNIERSSTSVHTSKRIRNVACSKARFDSTSLPFRRACLNYEALLTTAQQVVRLRRSTDEAKVAERFLTFCDEETLIQLAMMSDGGDEAIGHTRVCDSDDIDQATLPLEHDRFLSRIVMLFGAERRCLTSGCTGFMLEALKHPVIVMVGGDPKTIGGRDAVRPEVVQRCLARMQAWTKLARLVIRAEFPDWEILSAFSVFDAAGDSSSIDSSKHEMFRGYMATLARVFEADLGDLMHGFDVVLPVAQIKKRLQPSISNLDAWRKAV
jgi:hypothetical protein